MDSNKLVFQHYNLVQLFILTANNQGVRRQGGGGLGVRLQGCIPPFLLLFETFFALMIFSVHALPDQATYQVEQ